MLREYNVTCKDVIVAQKSVEKNNEIKLYVNITLKLAKELKELKRVYYIYKKKVVYAIYKLESEIYYVTVEKPVTVYIIYKKIKKYFSDYTIIKEKVTVYCIYKKVWVESRYYDGCWDSFFFYYYPKCCGGHWEKKLVCKTTDRWLVNYYKSRGYVVEDRTSYRYVLKKRCTYVWVKYKTTTSSWVVYYYGGQQGYRVEKKIEYRYVKEKRFRGTWIKIKTTTSLSEANYFRRKGYRVEVEKIEYILYRKTRDYSVASYYKERGYKIEEKYEYCTVLKQFTRKYVFEIARIDSFRTLVILFNPSNVNGKYTVVVRAVSSGNTAVEKDVCVKVSARSLKAVSVLSLGDVKKLKSD